MKFYSLLFISLISFLGQSQEKLNSNVLLTLNNQIVERGSVVGIHDFKNLKVTPSNNLDSLSVQFVIVPIGFDIFSFKKIISDLHTLDVLRMLEIGGIPESKISHVIISIVESELKPALYSVTVLTRKMELASDYFENFKSYAEAGNGEMAVWSIDQAIILDPENLEYLNAKGQLYFEMGELISSKVEFERIIASKPNSQSYILLASICMELGEFNNAINHSLKAVDLTSDSLEKSNRYDIIGTAMVKMFQYEEAYKSYKKALEFNPKNVYVLNNITTVLDKLNKTDEKVGYFKRIIEADSSFYLVHINIGFYYLSEKQFDLALQEFNSVLKIDSTQAIALSNKAFALHKLGENPEALNVINESIKYNPTNSYAYRNRALIHLELNKQPQACEDLETALNLNFTEQYGDEVKTLWEKHCR